LPPFPGRLFGELSARLNGGLSRKLTGRLSGELLARLIGRLRGEFLTRLPGEASTQLSARLIGRRSARLLAEFPGEFSGRLLGKLLAPFLARRFDQALVVFRRNVDPGAVEEGSCCHSERGEESSRCLLCGTWKTLHFVQGDIGRVSQPPHLSPISNQSYVKSMPGSSGATTVRIPEPGGRG